MLILYNHNFSKFYIINIIKLYSIKNYSQLNKPELIKLLNYTKASIYIQTHIRKFYIEDLTCPITLSHLKYPFVSIKNCSHI